MRARGPAVHAEVNLASRIASVFEPGWSKTPYNPSLPIQEGGMLGIMRTLNPKPETQRGR